MDVQLWALGGITAIAVATLAVGIWGSRTARTTSDFLVARRLVRVERNAAAISGEYLSAASFLGIAGLVLKDGADALWYPVGFAAGYLALMLFVAAPLRRSGAYTLPDFVEARLDSQPVRYLATALVVLIGWLYLVPQFQGAGLTLAMVTGLPYWSAVLAVVVMVLISVLSGGMRAVTLVQAFQYWVKLFAITLPAFVLVMVFLAQHGEFRRGLDEPAAPLFPRETTVRPQNDVTLRFSESVYMEVTGGRASSWPIGGSTDEPRIVSVPPGNYEVRAGTELRFRAGDAVPVAAGAEANNEAWLTPQQRGPRGLYETYSLIFATFLGTMGLPHVLVRFYTNPSGRGARRTTLFVLALLGTFYLFPAIFGLLSRFYLPQLLITDRTDAAVLLLPSAMLDNWLGGLLGAVTAAGAFAAFLSTCSGLLVSVAGVLSTDLLRGRTRVLDFRVLAVLSAAVPSVLALALSGQDISQSVALAFAMAASTFCPLLVLGIWWRGLTAVGAATGMLVGGACVLTAVVLNLVVPPSCDWASTILRQPAAVTVPLAFLVTWLASMATKDDRPPAVFRTMLRMHAPERLGYSEDRALTRFGEGEAEPSGGRHARDS